MCLICDHFNQGKLTVEEAGRNLDEISDSIGPEHTREVTAMIIEHEINQIYQLVDSLKALPFTEHQMTGFPDLDDYTMEDAIFDMDFELDFTV